MTTEQVAADRKRGATFSRLTDEQCRQLRRCRHVIVVKDPPRSSCNERKPYSRSVYNQWWDLQARRRVEPWVRAALLIGGFLLGMATTSAFGQWVHPDCPDTPAGAPEFERWDADADGRLTITDAIVTLRYVFEGGELGCHDAADINDDGRLNIVDPMLMLQVLFTRMTWERACAPCGRCNLLPSGTCGRSDPTPDALGCAETACHDHPWEGHP